MRLKTRCLLVPHPVIMHGGNPSKAIPGMHAHVVPFEIVVKSLSRGTEPNDEANPQERGRRDTQRKRVGPPLSPRGQTDG